MVLVTKYFNRDVFNLRIFPIVFMHIVIEIKKYLNLLFILL